MAPIMASFNAGSSRAVGFRSGGECKRPVKTEKRLNLNHNCQYVIHISDPTQCTVQPLDPNTGLPTGPVTNLDGTQGIIYNLDASTIPSFIGPTPFTAAIAASNGDRDINIPDQGPVTIVPGSVNIYSADRDTTRVDTARSWTGGKAARLVSVDDQTITIRTITYVIQNAGGAWIEDLGETLDIQIEYKIKNNCGTIDNNVLFPLRGTVTSAVVSIRMFFGETRSFSPVPVAITDMNFNFPDAAIADVQDAGWYTVVFETYSVVDVFWVRLTKKNPDRDTDNDNIPDTRSNIDWGPIGPVGDNNNFVSTTTLLTTPTYPSNPNVANTSGGVKQGAGYFLVYKPVGYDMHVLLNVFNGAGSGLTVSAIKAYVPAQPEEIPVKYPGFGRFTPTATLTTRTSIYNTLATSASLVGNGGATNISIPPTSSRVYDIIVTWEGGSITDVLTLVFGTDNNYQLGEDLTVATTVGRTLNLVRGTPGANQVQYTPGKIYRLGVRTTAGTTVNTSISIAAFSSAGAPVNFNTYTNLTVTLLEQNALNFFSYAYAPADVANARAALATYPNPIRYYTGPTTDWANRERLPINETGIVDWAGVPVSWQAVSGSVLQNSDLCLAPHTEPNPSRYFLDPNVRPTPAEVTAFLTNAQLANPVATAARGYTPQGTAGFGDCTATRLAIHGFNASADPYNNVATGGVDRTPYTLWPSTGKEWPNVWPWPADVIGADNTTPYRVIGTGSPGSLQTSIAVAPVTAAGVVNANGFAGQRNTM